MSDIKDYIEYIEKHMKHIHIYINRISDRLVLKIRDGYKLELQTHETMKLFDSTFDSFSPMQFSR